MSGRRALLPPRPALPGRVRVARRLLSLDGLGARPLGAPQLLRLQGVRNRDGVSRCHDLCAPTRRSESRRGVEIWRVTHSGSGLASKTTRDCRATALHDYYSCVCEGDFFGAGALAARHAYLQPRLDERLELLREVSSAAAALARSGFGRSGWVGRRSVGLVGHAVARSVCSLGLVGRRLVGCLVGRSIGLIGRTLARSVCSGIGRSLAWLSIRGPRGHSQ